MADVRQAGAAFFFAVIAAGLAVPANAQIVALGASNTAGQGVGAAKAFPAQVQALLKAAGRPMSVRNAGLSGDTTAGMLARLDKVTPKGTTIVILQFGGNDRRRGISDSQRQSNIDAIVSRLRARGIRAVMADDAVAAGLRSGLRQPDGIHLTAEGHRQVAETLVRGL